jgi:hypothetical protein
MQRIPRAAVPQSKIEYSRVRLFQADFCGCYTDGNEWDQPPPGAQAKNGRFEIVENLGAIDPDEAMVPSAAEFGRGPIA